ncbi:MAG TPA: YkvA family protein [Planctomycetota bacterium]|nr:YkvA family protein [Planctomycetota bacterium]
MLKQLKQVALFLPNIMLLTAALAKDARVPARTKAMLAAAAIYFVSPVDIIPDWIPVIGYLDDFVLAMIVLDVIVNCVDPEIVGGHWRGSQRSLSVGRRMAACCCFFIPKKLKHRIFAAHASS